MGRMILIPGADYSGANYGKVTPSEGLPIEGITINGPGAAYGYADFSVKLWPTFTSQREYTWSIVDGSNYASISPTGRLSVASGASQSPVTIRCASVANPNVYAEKVILCSSGTLTYYDWIQGDGSAYIYIDRFSEIVNATITVKYTTGDIGNTYLLSSRLTTALNTYDALALYLQNTGTTSRVAAGTKGTQTITSTNATSIRYRAIFKLSSTKTLADASFECYNDATEDRLVSWENFTNYVATHFTLFALMNLTEDSFTQQANGKFYGMTIVKDDITIADYRPCAIDGVPCVIDYISGLTYYNAASSGAFTVGND